MLDPWCRGLAQLSESLGEDVTSCTREQWDAFDMQPVEGVSEEGDEPATRSYAS